ncbi:MAG: energy-coupling factor ABC transporter permease [Pirellulaceae bacterium]
MHLGNGAITAECALLTAGAAAAGLGWAAVAARRVPLSRDRLLLAGGLLAGGLGALVFAAQAVNVQVLPGASAHLVGGVLLAAALGPSLGAWTMAIILAVQALVLGDGGLASLGANILNMAILPAGLVLLAKQFSAAESRLPHWQTAGLAVLAVPLAALLIVGETALFRSGAELAGWQAFAARMIGTHLWIGLAEGGLTLAAAVGLAWLARPAGAPQRALPTFASVIAAVAVAVAAFPWSSALPDGYEAAAESAGLGRWLAQGSGTLAAVQSAVVEAAQRVAPGEQACLVVAMLLTAAIVLAFASLSTRRQVAPG